MPFSRETRRKIAERQRKRKNNERSRDRYHAEKAELRKLRIDELRDRANQLIAEAYALEITERVEP